MAKQNKNSYFTRFSGKNFIEINMSLNYLADKHLKQSLEALLFVSGDALSLKEVALGLGEPMSRVQRYTGGAYERICRS